MCGAGTVALGFFNSARQQLQLNPSEGSRLEPGDSLVVLTKASGGHIVDVETWMSSMQVHWLLHDQLPYTPGIDW
jgi:hypothetical protein